MIENEWVNVTRKDWWNWWNPIPPIGVTIGWFNKTGLVDTSALGFFLKNFITKSQQRDIIIGTTNIETGGYEYWDSSTSAENLIHKSIASSSVPVFFPY